MEKCILTSIQSEDISEHRVRIRSFINNGAGKRYIPGSSIKGAFRTAVLYKNVQENRNLQNKLMDFVDEERRRKDFDKPLEKALFGHNPFKDYFKALKFSDTIPLKSKRMAVRRIYSYNLKEKGTTPVFLECWSENVSLPFSLTINPQDLVITSRKGAKSEELLDELLSASRKFAYDQIDRELSVLSKKLPDQSRAFYSAIRERYTNLKESIERLEDNETVLRIGHGSGFFGITINLLLYPDELIVLRRKYRIGQSRRIPGEYSEFFPLTRLLIAGEGEKPISPLGWSKISFTQK